MRCLLCDIEIDQETSHWFRARVADGGGRGYGPFCSTGCLKIFLSKTDDDQLFILFGAETNWQRDQIARLVERAKVRYANGGTVPAYAIHFEEAEGDGACYHARGLHVKPEECDDCRLHQFWIEELS